MPLGLTLTNEGLWRWLSTRAIPQNRRFATELCRSLGLATFVRNRAEQLSELSEVSREELLARC